MSVSTRIVRRRNNEALKSLVVQVVAFCLLAVTWELLTRGLGSLLIPTFSETIAALYQLVFVTGRIWEPLFVSNQAMVVGYLLSVVLGVPLGLAMARAGQTEALVSPYIVILLAMPVAPLIPIASMAMGLGLASRVFVVMLFTFVFITVNVRAGVRTIDPMVIQMARVFGASEIQIWRKILIPGALPTILAGLRIGLGRAVGGMVTVELLLIAVGVGRLMLEFQGRFEKAMLYAVVLAIIAESVVLIAAMRAIERRFVTWTDQGARN